MGELINRVAVMPGRAVLEVQPGDGTRYGVMLVRLKSRTALFQGMNEEEQVLVGLQNDRGAWTFYPMNVIAGDAPVPSYLMEKLTPHKWTACVLSWILDVFGEEIVDGMDALESGAYFGDLVIDDVKRRRLVDIFAENGMDWRHGA